jgi:homoserine dehydrogenase
MTYATQKEKGKKIKLVPTIKKLDANNVAAFVVPQLINNENYLFNVENEYNGVIVEGAFSDKQFLFGKGAGGNPTGSAVLSDISALSYGYRYEYKKFKQNNDIKLNNNILIDIYLRYNNADDLNKIKFESINEKYSSGNYNYVIGRINLKQLIANRDYIQKENLFFARVGEEIGVVGAKENALAEEKELVLG